MFTAGDEIDILAVRNVLRAFSEINRDELLRERFVELFTGVKDNFAGPQNQPLRPPKEYFVIELFYENPLFGVGCDLHNRHRTDLPGKLDITVSRAERRGASGDFLPHRPRRRWATAADTSTQKYLDRHQNLSADTPFDGIHTKNIFVLHATCRYMSCLVSNRGSSVQK